MGADCLIQEHPLLAPCGLVFPCTLFSLRGQTESARRLLCAAFHWRCQDKLRQREPKREDFQPRRGNFELFLITNCHPLIPQKSLSLVLEWVRRRLTERPRLEALRTELPSPLTEAGDARTVKNYGKIEAGLIERDASSITVPDTRETLDYFIYPCNFQAALRSAPQAALLFFF